MKALTLKKTAVAAALLAAAGSATAATDNLFVGSYTNAANVITKADATGAVSAYHVVAAESLFAGPAVTIPETADVIIAVKSASAALENGDKVTFTFANGGLDASKTYKLVAIDDEANAVLQNISTSVDSATTSNTTHSQITFTIDNAAAADADQNDYVYLVQDTAADDTNTTTGTAAEIDDTNEYGVVVKVNEDTVAKSVVSVTASIDYSDANDADITTETEVLARVYQNASMTLPATVTGAIDFIDDALEFTTGKTLTASGFVLDNVANGETLSETDDKVDWSNDGTVTGTYTIDTTVAGAGNPVADTVVAGATAKVSVVGESCNAIDTFTVGGTEVDIKTGTSCTYEDDIANGEALAMTVDGKTVLTANKFTATYELTQSSQVTATTPKTQFVWDSNVQTGDALTFPLLVAANDNSAAFSLVKVDNSKVDKDTAIVISGTVEQITFGENGRESAFIPFTNYKLNKTIAANTLGQITGDDVIDSLLGLNGGFGSADFGFNTTALEGLNKEALHHISVVFNVSTAETSGGDFGQVEAYIRSGDGRTQITAGGQDAK